MGVAKRGAMVSNSAAGDPAVPMLPGARFGGPVTDAVFFGRPDAAVAVRTGSEKIRPGTEISAPAQG